MEISIIDYREPGQKKNYLLFSYSKNLLNECCYTQCWESMEVRLDGNIPAPGSQEEKEFDAGAIDNFFNYYILLIK